MMNNSQLVIETLLSYTPGNSCSGQVDDDKVWQNKRSRVVCLSISLRAQVGSGRGGLLADRASERVEPVLGSYLE